MSKLLVGFGKANIDPIEPIHLAGLPARPGNPRIWDGDILDPISTICVAITDENDKTVLLISNDLCQIQFMEGMKDFVVQATGVPADNVYVSCTHTHSSPTCHPESEQGRRYAKYVALKMAVAAAEAMRDRKPATMEFTKTETEALTFSRRYLNTLGGIYTNINGTIRVGPEEEPDNFLQLLRFKREGGKDILLSNFQGHYHGSSTMNENYTKISANYYGIYRQEMEDKTGCHVIYFSGAGGNLAARATYHPERNVSTDYVDHGKRLAGYALDEKLEYKPLEAGDIRNRSMVYTGLTRKEPDLLEVSQKVMECYRATGDKDEAMKLAEGTRLRNVGHASCVIRNLKMDDTFQVELKALSIGDLGIVTAPCEMFSSIGEKVKAESPFKETLVFQLTDGSIGYIPSSCAYDHGGYEVTTTPFERGIAEGYHDTFMTMLKDMKEEK